MTRIEIDPNVRVESGWTYSGFEDVTGPVPMVGELVTVFESEDRIQGEAFVTRVDRDRRLVYLDVDWSSLRDMDRRRG